MKNALDSKTISKYFSQKNIDSYINDLKKWLNSHDLWHLLGPSDHFAIKVPDEEILLLLVDAIKPHCHDSVDGTPGLSIRKMDNRLVATGLLKNSINNTFNKIYCLEIMQSKPNNIGKDPIGLDHLEFINSDFEGVQIELKKKLVPYGVNITNGYKKTIIVKINKKGEEVKFTDKTLAEVVPLQINDQPELVTIILPKKL